MVDFPRTLPPDDSERLRTAVRRYIPGAFAGGDRFAKPVQPNPFAARPNRPGGGGAPIAFVRWEVLTLGQALGTTLVDWFLVTSSVFGPWDAYLSYDGVDQFPAIQDCWVQAGLDAVVTGANPASPYVGALAAGEYGGATIPGSGSSTVFIVGAGLATPFRVADFASLSVSVLDPTGSGGAVDTCGLSATIWAP